MANARNTKLNEIITKLIDTHPQYVESKTLLWIDPDENIKKSSPETTIV